MENDMAAESATAIRLLIVDDIADNRIVLNRRFKTRGFDITEADSGLAAVRLIDQQDFDLVLLDIMMPGIDGIEVLKRIRSKYSADRLPVIMVTGKTFSADIVEALELGANDYLTKPVDFAIALARVQSQLTRKQAQQALERSISELVDVNQKLENELAELNRSNVQRDHAPAFLDMVIESVPITLIVKNARNGRYTMVNRAAEDLWGIARTGIIGKTARDIFDKDEADRIEARDVAALHSGQRLATDEQPMQTPGNGTRLISTKGVVIQDASGKPEYLLNVMEDITERAALERTDRPSYRS
jgi:PAS domain S-box-containing protein